MNKEEYIAMLENKVADLNERLEKLKLQAKLAEMESREKMQNEIEEYQAKRDDLTATLERMQHSGENAWGELREGAEQAYESMRDALQRAKSHIQQ